jgi:hypothetical protein
MSDSNPDNSNNNSNPQAVPPASDNQPNEIQPHRRRSLQSLLWVILVLATGAIVGVVSFLLIAPHLSLRGFFPGFPPSSGYIMDIFSFIAEHIILSTISIALLVSLVIVYGKIYRQTRANFALGIFIVLLALMFETILNYPILQLLTTGYSVNLASSPLPTLADTFTIVAYSVFLYLSLE